MLGTLHEVEFPSPLSPGVCSNQKDPNRVTVYFIVGLGKIAYLLPKMEKRKSDEPEDDIPPPSEDNETTSSGEEEFLLAVRTGLASSAPHWSSPLPAATQHTPASGVGPSLFIEQSS